MTARVALPLALAVCVLCGLVSVLLDLTLTESIGVGFVGFFVNVALMAGAK